MAQFRVTYGVGGGYNDITEEVIEVANLEVAMRDAYDAAVAIFDSYSIFENETELDEYENDAEREAAYLECLESWIDYHAVPVE